VESSVKPIVDSLASPPPTGDVVHETAPWRAPRWETPPAGSPVRLRLDLQRRARYNLRRHVLRAATRFGVLALADLASFGVMRALLRAVRDDTVLGDWVASQAEAISPHGILNGWQYAAALFVSLLVLGCYGRGDRRRDARRLFAACALATALPLWMTIWTRGLDIVLLQFALTTMLVWAGLVAERLTVDRLVDRVRPPERTAARTLFVGTGEECARVAETSAFRDRREFVSVGFVDVNVPPSIGARGHVVEIGRALHDSGAETVVVCGQLSDGLFHTVIEAALAAGCHLLSVPRATAIAGVHPTTVWRRGQALVELTAPTLKGWQLALKRVVDLVGATVGLVVAAPVLLAVAMAIKVDSPGSVFFRQDRVGRGGKRFKVVKFRTMVRDAEAKRDALLEQNIYPDSRLFKMPADPRVTNLGWWLRRMSMDELPQLWNVLKGDMSLVGPRPPLPCEVELYEAHHYARFDVKPGMTGPWQVSGRNEIRNFDQIVEIETAYIRNWSLYVDLQLLARTVPAVIKRRGAF